MATIGHIWPSDVAMLLRTLAVASVPPVYAASQLDEGILCVLAFFILGKLGYGEVFSSLMIGDQLSFSSHLKCHQEATH
jgi:hypothetical protein